MPQLTVNELTGAKVTGTGVFDVLMQSVKAHLDQEFLNGRIKGPEYSTVYLGSLNLAMQTGLAFLLQKDKQDLELQLLQKQIELAGVQVSKAEVELEILQETKLKIPHEIALLQAQTELVGAQADNEVIQGQNLTKQGEVLVVQKLQIEQQTANLAAEVLNIPKQGVVLDRQASHISQQTSNLAAEALNIPKQGELLTAQKSHILQQTSNLTSEALNIPKVGQKLDDESCLLKSQYTNTLAQTRRVEEEITLLTQKTATERAQTQAVGVDENSVVGKQKQLYAAQTDGFKRDAEQKAAKLLADTWSVRRTTDEATAGAPAGLGDSEVARAVQKLLQGVGA